MDLAPRYTLSTLFTLFNILHICQTVALCLYTLLGDVRALMELEHNCTIFLCSLDVRNIVQGGDPLYAGFFSTQGSGGYT